MGTIALAGGGISKEQGAYLGMLPDEQVLYIPGTQPVAITHGVPGRNRVGFFNEQSDTSIASELTLVKAPTFISAHTHVQMDRHVSLAITSQTDVLADPPEDHLLYGEAERHWHVINPGSVGLPLNGDATAQFAIMTSVPEEKVAGGWQATHLRVAYDRRPLLDAFATTGMAAAGGVITELLYWEVVTAESEIARFYRWARTHGYDPEFDRLGTFHAYCQQTGRDSYVRSRDPLSSPARSI